MTLKPEHRHTLLRVATKSLAAAAGDLRNAQNAISALGLDEAHVVTNLLEPLLHLHHLLELEVTQLEGKAVPHA